MGEPEKSLRKLYRPSWAAWIALGAHLLWIAFFAFIFWAGPVEQRVDTVDGEFSAPHCELCESASDSIKAAHEIGRLDQVSLALTVLGVALAVMAFAGFFVVRAAAMNAAREEARAMANELIPGLVTESIVRDALGKNPKLVFSAVSEVLTPYLTDIAADDANHIAGAFGGEDHE